MPATAAKTTTATTLPKSIFAVDIANHQLIRLAYEAYLANGRGNYAKTLKRGEVSGGGRKPWRQKGTGHARVGSSRSPIWRKGGITFGPTGNENYSKTVPLTIKRTALRQALTLANLVAKAVVVAPEVKTTGKTKEVTAYLAKQGVGTDDQAVLVVDTKPAELIRASRNVANLQVVQAKYLNVFTVLNADKILITPAAVKVVEEWLKV